MIQATENGKQQQQQINCETITIEGVKSPIYRNLLSHTAMNINERMFMGELRKALKSRVKSFKIPKYDFSISSEKTPEFVAGATPAVYYSFNELKKMSSKYNLRIGTKEEYILYLATMISCLMDNGWTEVDAWNAVCFDSSKLGNFNSDAMSETGSKEIVEMGKFDAGNTFKILSDNKNKNVYYLAGGYYGANGSIFPFASFTKCEYNCDIKLDYSTCWFVVD